MKSTPSATEPRATERRLLRGAFALAGLALALRATGIVDFERPLNALPSLCLFHRLTGHDCPGCGMTRAFLRLAHGDIAGAWQMHPFSIPLLIFTLALAVAPESALDRFRQSKAGKMLPVLALLLVLGWWTRFKLIG